MSENPSASDVDEIDPAEQREIVRERYAAAAAGSSGCGCGGSSCYGDGDGESTLATESTDATEATEATEPTESTEGTAATVVQTDAQTSRSMGYSADEVEAVASGANLGLGCGNPTAIANLSPGESVLDLGSGGGFDCFLAAREVGDEGRVVGVDMTPEMVEKARRNVEKNDADNVEFRLGEIENLPVADASIDVILSNCVVNLSPDKPRVFREAQRVLRPGGRLAITDVVRTADLPAELEMDPDSVAGCVAGASTVDSLESMLSDAGFVDIAIEPKDDSESFIREWDDSRDLSEFITSARIEARKPD